MMPVISGGLPSTKTLLNSARICAILRAASASPLDAASASFVWNDMSSASARNSSGSCVFCRCARMNVVAMSCNSAISSGGRRCLYARCTVSNADWQKSWSSPSLSRNSRMSSSAACPSPHFFTSNENSSNLMPRHDRTPPITLGHLPSRTTTEVRAGFDRPRRPGADTAGARTAAALHIVPGEIPREKREKRWFFDRLLRSHC